MMLTGIVSAATVAQDFVGCLDVFIELPGHFIIIFSIGPLCALVCWSINESVTTAAIITILEILGLLLIIAVAIMFSDSENGTDLQAVTGTDFEAGFSGLMGAFLPAFLLTFQAYINFGNL